MKNVLYILGQLTDEDIEWMIDNGKGEYCRTDEELIREGQSIDSLYITFEGRFGVFIDSLQGRKLNELGPGEIVGEMSFVQYHPPMATVRALEDGYVLVLSRQVLATKLEADAAFAARFYKAVAIMLADRLRDSLTWINEINQQGSGEGDTADLDELHLDMLGDISRAGERFERLVKRVKGV
jgi:CRP/FNR family transcriptional regulator, cyclic AMP receptor protein